MKIECNWDMSKSPGIDSQEIKEMLKFIRRVKDQYEKEVNSFLDQKVVSIVSRNRFFKDVNSFVDKRVTQISKNFKSFLQNGSNLLL